MARAAFLSKDNPILTYLKETRAEVQKVSWPTRQEALRLTVVVLIVTVSMAVILGTVDYFFSKVISFIVSAI